MRDGFDRAIARTTAERRQKRMEIADRLMKRGFQIHLKVFVWVQAVLIAIWALQWQLGGTPYPWFLVVLVGWGIGLAIHYAVIRKGPCRGLGRARVTSR
jgi:ABC-type polysaccharide/polyol phosphate export permease